MNKHGFDNVRYLEEASHPDYHGETHMNYYQGKKYGDDVAFVFWKC